MGSTPSSDLSYHRCGIEEDSEHAANKSDEGYFIEKGSASGGSWLPLVNYEALPEWHKDNCFILSGYRKPDFLTTRQCLFSIFMMHNETGNIWSHLLGCLACFVMAGYMVYDLKHLPTVGLFDYLAFASFFVGGAACFGLSSYYHTIACKNEAASCCWAKADYVGIAFLIWGSSVPLVRVLFYEDHQSQMGYILGISAMAFVVGMCMITPKFQKPRYRKCRAAVFSLLGLSGLAPAVQYGVSPHFAEYPQALYLLAVMGTLYLFGALLFASRMPERIPLLRGVVDNWGNSHQIFHVLCVAAYAVHYYNCRATLAYRVESLGGFQVAAPPHLL